MVISRATTDDIPQLVELLAILFEQEAEFHPDPDAQTAALNRIIQSPEVGAILVLRDASRVIGMVNLLYSISTALGNRAALLEDMIIRPTHRGQGLGTRLLNAALEHAQLAGCHRVTLLTDSTNHRAQAFYARAGFQRSEMLTMRWTGGLTPPTDRNHDMETGRVV